MNYKERTMRLEYLKELIEKGRCLSITDMAARFSCSKRTAKRLIAELKDEDFTVKYSRGQNKFIKHE